VTRRRWIQVGGSNLRFLFGVIGWLNGRNLVPVSISEKEKGGKRTESGRFKEKFISSTEMTETRGSAGEPERTAIERRGGKAKAKAEGRKGE